MVLIVFPDFPMTSPAVEFGTIIFTCNNKTVSKLFHLYLVIQIKKIVIPKLGLFAKSINHYFIFNECCILSLPIENNCF